MRDILAGLPQIEVLSRAPSTVYPDHDEGRIRITVATDTAGPVVIEFTIFDLGPSDRGVGLGRSALFIAAETLASLAVSFETMHHNGGSFVVSE